MKSIVITAGETFTDIDVFACACAYAELLVLEGKKAEIVLPGVLNASVTKTIREWGVVYVTAPTDSDSDIIIVDVSESDYLAKFVRPEKVVEVFDHRVGFENFWQQKIGDDSHIELVGACATLIWEQFKKRGFAEKITTVSANLLTMAIVSNTLNFGAQVTHGRDVLAYDELKAYSSLPANWMEVYFQEQEEFIYTDVVGAIKSDTKTLHIPQVGFPVVMGQMELWNASAFLDGHKMEAKKALETFSEPHWFLSLPSISEKKNYVYTESGEIKKLLARIVSITFNGNVGVTDKLWLRKEIRKKLLEL